uniref:Uncharacterized protein n=1 Tax=Anguilla anguilla TaxID=7936 RepID=A0A0E9WXF2_ANGAN
MLICHSKKLSLKSVKFASSGFVTLHELLYILLIARLSWCTLSNLQDISDHFGRENGVGLMVRSRC